LERGTGGPQLDCSAAGEKGSAWPEHDPEDIAMRSANSRSHGLTVNRHDRAGTSPETRPQMPEIDEVPDESLHSVLVRSLVPPQGACGLSNVEV
jgi:hypothetical protein